MMIHFVTFYFQPQGSNVTIMMYGITGLNPNNKYAVLIFLCMYVHRTFEHKKPNVILSEGGTGENLSDVTPLNFWIVLIYLFLP